jgi:amino-acid N-acetyltransferase
MSPIEPLVIRRADPGDWDRIAALLTAAALPVDGAREQLSGFLVAVRGADLVGCAAVERYGDAGLLRSVAVAGSERGLGTGAALVERCIAESKRAEIGTLVLLTTTAEGWFPRFGFVATTWPELPAAVSGSAELQGACPSSAIAMRLTL